MPVGNSNGKFFEDDFEAALDEVKRPSAEQMRDPMEIDPNTHEAPVFDPSLVGGMKVNANWFTDKPTPMVAQPQLATVTPQENLEGAFKGVQQSEQDTVNRIINERDNGQAEIPANASSTEGKTSRSFVDVLTGQDGKERYQTWPERAVRHMNNTIKTFMTTEPGSDENIAASYETAKALVFGPGAPAALGVKLADGTLGSFAGASSRTFNKEAYKEAREMDLIHGKTPEEIWRKTGMFKGADDMWRYEIKDYPHVVDGKELGLRLKGWNSENGRLEQFIDHPELFKAYPELKNIEVRVNTLMNPKGASAMRINGKDILEFGSSAIKEKEAIMHEIQHVIQRREGFAAGGSIDKNPKLKYDEQIDEVRKDFFKFKDTISPGGITKKELTKEEADQLKYYEDFFKHYAKYSSAARDMAKENYKRLAGEVESRNVEKRLNTLTTEYPWLTEDRPRSLQHVTIKPVISNAYGYE